MTRNVCWPAARPLYAIGDAQAVAAAPSSEQLTLVGEPVVVQANDAAVDVVDEAGLEVTVTVGAVDVLPDVTVHVYDALLDPAELETATTNRCVPASSPLYERGEVQLEATPPSSEHVTLVGDPVVVHVNAAEVDVVVVGGPELSETVGATAVGGGAEPLSSSVPKSCVQ